MWDGSKKYDKIAIEYWGRYKHYLAQKTLPESSFYCCDADIKLFIADHSRWGDYTRGPLLHSIESTTLSRAVFLVELLCMHSELVPSIRCRFSSPWQLSIDSIHLIWYRFDFLRSAQIVLLVASLTMNPSELENEHKISTSEPSLKNLLFYMYCS